jgi:hypothetical protein
MANQRQYWFLAKRYGWGWGMPIVWQGWLVMLVYCVLLGITVSLLSANIVALSVCVGLESSLMMLVCYLKGEPLAWHWGDK